MVASAMFHQGKGPFGFKLDFADRAFVEGVSVTQVGNVGEVVEELCDSTWWIYEGKDYLGPGMETYSGGDVHGATVSKAFNTQLVMQTTGKTERKGQGFDLGGGDSGDGSMLTSWLVSMAIITSPARCRLRLPRCGGRPSHRLGSCRG